MSRSEGRCTYLLSSLQMSLVKACSDIEIFLAASVMTTSEFSRARNTSVNFDVFNSRDDIYLVFTEKKVSCLFILYFLEDLRLIN